MDFTKITKPEMQVVGIEARTKNDLEASPVTAKIPGLWSRFFREKRAEEIDYRKDDSSLLGAYTNYESGHTGFYTLIVGAEVSELGMISKGMVGITIPAAEYLLFPAPGKMPEAIIIAWSNIWKHFSQNAAYQRAYTTDFELYRTTDDGQIEAEIYIAVR
jgi:predicted transcriptional regulator YdeE